MSKAQLIRDMLKSGRSKGECAAAAGCSESYVRSVIQRTALNGHARQSNGDTKYFTTHPERAEKRREYWRAWRARNPEKSRENRRKQHHTRYGVDMDYTEKARERARDWYRRKAAAKQGASA